MAGTGIGAEPRGLAWSAFTRDGVKLAECHRGAPAGGAGPPRLDPDVLALARKLLAKKPTPGWEFEKGAGKLRAAKFHLHEQLPAGRVVWAACCVYDSGAMAEARAKSFVEKLILLTEPLRESPEWRAGGELAAQASFAPMLQQRMEQADAGGKVARVQDQVDGIKEIMSNNINLMLARGQQLEELDDKATALSKVSQQFARGAHKAKRFQLWQQAKFGGAVGTAVTVGVGVVTIPPLVAVMGPAGWAVGGVAAVGGGVAAGVKAGKK